MARNAFDEEAKLRGFAAVWRGGVVRFEFPAHGSEQVGQVTTAYRSAAQLL